MCTVSRLTDDCSARRALFWLLTQRAHTYSLQTTYLEQRNLVLAMYQGNSIPNSYLSAVGAPHSYAANVVLGQSSSGPGRPGDVVDDNAIMALVEMSAACTTLQGEHSPPLPCLPSTPGTRPCPKRMELVTAPPEHCCFVCPHFCAQVTQAMPSCQAPC